jgi:hypothetical protein
VTNDPALKDGAIEGLLVEDWLGRSAMSGEGVAGRESLVGFERFWTALLVRRLKSE